MDVEKGIDLGRNISGNIAAQNEKMKKALSTNDEVFGDLSLGSGLINDLERRKTRDRLICKVVVMGGLSIVTTIVLLRFYLKH